MNAVDRTHALFDEAKELGLINPITGDGMPTPGMVASAINDAEYDARNERKTKP